jgi:hypothetical protein
MSPSNCCNRIYVPCLKPAVALVRRSNVVTTFYPLAVRQPHPACALRRNLVRVTCPISESVALATQGADGHVHFNHGNNK